MTTPPNPWDRLPGENNLWFDRFDRYRLAGPTRSLEAIWRQDQQFAPNRRPSKRPNSTWYDISAKFRWKERAQAWDEYQRQQTRAEHDAKLAEARAAVARVRMENITAGRFLKSRGLAQLQKYLETAPELLTPMDCMTLVLHGIKLELAALGEPETVTETRSTTPEEAAKRHALFADIDRYTEAAIAAAEMEASAQSTNPPANGGREPVHPQDANGQAGPVPDADRG